MTSDTPRPAAWPAWAALLLATATLGVVLWACTTAWGAVVHGHPAYAIVLGVSALAALLLGWRAPRRIGHLSNGLQAQAHRFGVWGIVWRGLLIVLGAGWIAALAWLRPYTAIEPALAAMQSDSTVTVTETATSIELRPVTTNGDTGVFFQPGALVDAHAYAAVLRPLAEAGHTVVIAKQPLGIAFLALPAFDSAKASHPDISEWVVAGHSLGGTVAAIEAAEQSTADENPSVVGLLLYASYPANDISETLSVPVASISASLDGLATPQKIAASRKMLPADAIFTVIEGASHAQFGSYGSQRGDNEPLLSDANAREQISEASLSFVESLTDSLRK
ncbi:alpha/beta hydrolase [Leucobacter insecticola]|uniref:Alpha/beta hydrolase n=1 Tax=Leucobacter insecticola TaxID=2714934 RepID=A0A6G8FG09_9MICO|nr:alpha/beta hydrolase [Leucobacter insecticola]QIM15446.1 alpha/beta hydrolase [Leucobacter insecticola]